MKIFLVITVARQYEGDIISIRHEKAYKTASQAQEHLNSLKKSFVETINVPNIGPIEFFCERGIQEVDLVEEGL